MLDPGHEAEPTSPHPQLMIAAMLRSDSNRLAELARNLRVTQMPGLSLIESAARNLGAAAGERESAEAQTTPSHLTLPLSPP